MLPLPEFTLHSPKSIEEALRLLAQPDAMIIAGGTDLLPNMKQGLHSPAHVVSLQHLVELREVRVEEKTIVLGAMTSLEELAENEDLQLHATALAEAAGTVGGPHHRRMGTLGGNLCLDTRCRYYNQSQFWRSALGFCLKKDGEVCHVVEGGKKCVAAASNDTAAAAIALEAVLVIRGAKGVRRVPAAEFFVADGARNIAIGRDELLVALEIPRVAKRVSAYEKLRRRGAIDFPLLSVAVRVDGAQAEVVVSALAAKPRRINGAQKLAASQVEELAEAAARECNPMPNVDGDVVWRKQMVKVLVKRALSRALGEEKQT